MAKIKRKKSLVAYGNEYATDVVFAKQHGPIYPENVVMPFLLKKPYGECNKKVRITLEEI